MGWKEEEEGFYWLPMEDRALGREVKFRMINETAKPPKQDSALPAVCVCVCVCGVCDRVLL